MRILVTGATGFIGSRLLARLAVECDKLRILRRAKSSPEAIKNIKYEEVVGDIINLEDVGRAVEGCDVVFNVAASVAYWDKLNKHQYDINIVGTRNVVQACLKYGVKRLIHTSSIVAIGILENGLPADETIEYNLAPLRINYCDTKHLAEEEVQKGVQKGLDAVIVNPGAVFGPGDLRRFRGHLYGGRVWAHIFYVGGGIATVDVDDVVEGHVRAWKKGRCGERYILANENLTFREISDTISVIMNNPPLIPPLLKGGRGGLWGIIPPFFKGRLGGIINKIRIRIPTPVVFVIAHAATLFSKIFGTKPLATIPMAKFTRIKLFFSNEKSRQELGMTYHPFRESVERAIEWFGDHGYL